MPPKRADKKKQQITDYDTLVSELVKLRNLNQDLLKPNLMTLREKAVGKLKGLIGKIVSLDEPIIYKILNEISVDKDTFYDAEFEKLSNNPEFKRVVGFENVKGKKNVPIYEPYDKEYIDRYIEMQWESRPTLDVIVDSEIHEAEQRAKNVQKAGAKGGAQQDVDMYMDEIIEPKIYERILNSDEYLDTMLRISIEKELQRRRMRARDPRVVQNVEDEMKRRKEYEMAGINIDQEEMFDAAVQVANNLLENDEYARKNEIFAKALDRFKETLVYNDEEDVFLNEEEIEDFKKALDKEFKTREAIRKRKGYKKRKLVENLETEIEALDALRDAEASKLIGNGKMDQMVYNEMERIDNLTDVLRKFRDETKKQLPEDIDEEEYKDFLEERKRAVNNSKKYIDLDNGESLEQYFNAPYLEEQYSGYRKKQKQVRKVIRKKYNQDEDMDFVDDEEEDKSVVDDNDDDDKSLVGDNEEGFVEIEDKKEDDDEDDYEPMDTTTTDNNNTSDRQKMVKRFPHLVEKGYKPDIFKAHLGKVTKKRHEFERVDLKRKALPTKYNEDKTGCLLWQTSPWVKNKIKMWVRIIKQNDNVKYDIGEDVGDIYFPEVQYKYMFWYMPSMNLYKLLCHENTNIELLNNSNLVITNDKLDKHVVVCIIYEVGKSKYALYDTDYKVKKPEFVELNADMYNEAKKYIKKSKMSETAKVFELLSNPVDNDARKFMLNMIKESIIDMIVNSNDKLENHPDLMPNSVFYTNFENEFYTRSKTLSEYVNLISTFLYYIGPISIQYPGFVNDIKDLKYTYLDLVDMSERNCLKSSLDDGKVPNEPDMLSEIFRAETLNNDIVLKVNESLRVFTTSLQQYVASILFSKLNPFYQLKYRIQPKPYDLNGKGYKSKSNLPQEELEPVVPPTTTTSLPEIEIEENEIDDLMTIIKNDLEYSEYVDDKQDYEPLPLPLSTNDDDDDEYVVRKNKKTKLMFNGTPDEVVGSLPSNTGVMCKGCNKEIKGKPYNTFVYNCVTDTAEKAVFCTLRCMSKSINDDDDMTPK